VPDFFGEVWQVWREHAHHGAVEQAQCGGSGEAAFGQALQSNYSKVGLAPDASTMLQGIDDVVRTDAALSTACTGN